MQTGYKNNVKHVFLKMYNRISSLKPYYNVYMLIYSLLNTNVGRTPFTST